MPPPPPRRLLIQLSQLVSGGNPKRHAGQKIELENHGPNLDSCRWFRFTVPFSRDLGKCFSGHGEQQKGWNGIIQENKRTGSNRQVSLFQVRCHNCKSHGIVSSFTFISTVFICESPSSVEEGGSKDCSVHILLGC